MKIKFIYSISLAVLSLVACNEKAAKDKSDVIDMLEVDDSKAIDRVSFEGIWTRKFSMGEGKEQQVFYTVNTKEIEYKMAGAVPMTYTIKMDTFIAKDNRWIGKKGEIPYVVFAKNITSDSISLYKQKVKNLEEALALPFPSDTTRSQFTSWNVYQKGVE